MPFYMCQLVWRGNVPERDTRLARDLPALLSLAWGGVCPWLGLALPWAWRLADSLIPSNNLAE